MEGWIHCYRESIMTLEELRSNIKWWESRRLIFNLLVGLIGALAIYNGLSQCNYSWTVADTLSIICWGLGANVFYSLGFLLEIFDWYYLDNKIGIKKFRLLFFVTGTIFSCLWTYWCTWGYFIGHIW